MADVVASCLGGNETEIRTQVSILDGGEVIDLHNWLKDIDDGLRDRWYELGSPTPELLK